MTKNELESEIQNLMETIKGYTTWSPTGSEALSEMFLPLSTRINPELTQNQTNPYVRRLSKLSPENTEDSGD